MLILDLDDTIFETKSMNPKIFESSILVLKNYYSNKAPYKWKKIEMDLWSKPIDIVFSTYNTPKEIVERFNTEISTIEFKELNISPFKDYHIIRNNTSNKVLVTTGLKELQMAKVKALAIENDFERIYIDDPREVPRRNKKQIFESILEEFKLLPEHIWIIGDNPESEIKAGKALKMKTIQRKSASKKISRLSDFVISSFEELSEIIK